MIKITFKNGNVCTWEKNEYTNYKYDAKCFVIIKDDQWIGFYNIDSVMPIVIG